MNYLDNLRGSIQVIEHEPRTGGRCLRRSRSVVPGVVLFLLSLAHLSQAAEFSCAAGDVACLIDAINMANANGEENTISLEAGFYTLTRSIAAGPGSPLPVTGAGLPSISSSLTIKGASGISTVIERDPTLTPSPPFFRLFNVLRNGNLTLADLTLQGGMGMASPFGIGVGGVWNDGGILTVVDSVIRRNHSGSGGGCGGILSTGTLTLVRTTITENISDFNGGGLCAGTTLILESSITSNAALLQGGGILGGPFLVQNSTIAGNTSLQGTGAGVSSSQATFINSTIADNVNDNPGPGAGIHVESTEANLVTLVNTILARNQSGGSFGPSDCDGTLTSFGNNLIGDPSGCTLTLLPTDLTGDPGLGRFKDNGRPGNGHFPLNHKSQAIDEGNDAICPRVDQLGRLRIGPCDIGAIRFEKRGK